jgi:hypothetical protein
VVLVKCDIVEAGHVEGGEGGCGGEEGECNIRSKAAARASRVMRNLGSNSKVVSSTKQAASYRASSSNRKRPSARAVWVVDLVTISHLASDQLLGSTTVPRK